MSDYQQQRIAELERARDGLAAALDKAKSYMRAASLASEGFAKAKLLNALSDLIGSRYEEILAARLAAERKAGAVGALREVAERWSDMGRVSTVWLELHADEIERGEGEK